MIEIYTKADCGYCVAAKEFMKINNVEYTEHTIGVDLTREEFLERFPDVKTVPMIMVDGNNIGGYDNLLEHITLRNKNVS